MIRFKMIFHFFLLIFQDINLNNIKDIDEKVFIEIFEALRNNDSLVRFEAANCDVTDFAAAVLNTALEQNRTLKSLNLDTNLITPDTLGGLFEAISDSSNTIIEIHVNDQAQSNMGYVSIIFFVNIYVFDLNTKVS